MPIAPEHRWLYPIDWPQLSKLVRFRRARGRCEHCHRPHGRDVIHMGEGTWWDEDNATWRTGKGRRVRALPALVNHSQSQLVFNGMEPPHPRRTHVVLAAAHLNHDPSDNRPRNLAALCQRCHMIHDADEHRRRRWLNHFHLCAIRDLFA
jgi:hypothetical protein